MSKPAWMDSVERVVDPLAQLSELGQRLDDPARRLAWRSTRKELDAAVTDANRAYNEAALRPSRKVPAAQIADLHEQLELAKGRAGVLALVEELAERTRLRVTATVLRPGETGHDPQSWRLLAARVSTGVDELLDALEADFVHPDEVHRRAEAALGDLLNRHLSVEATGQPDQLRRWAGQVEFALAVIQTTSTRA
ncbi:hypothetical protein GCM10009760_53200 [Kitasatospora kazusensis]|uniref:Uncharacterized protein n=1 Tax=Kitasatospora kazusensis TaxID=407974 RepID=A0ABP5LUQ6_9ACTN